MNRLREARQKACFQHEWIFDKQVVFYLPKRARGRTGMPFSLQREPGRYCRPESGIAPLGSASNPKATPVRFKTKGRWDTLALASSSSSEGVMTKALHFDDTSSSHAKTHCIVGHLREKRRLQSKPDKNPDESP